MVEMVPMRSSWLKSTTSSTVMLPVALGYKIKLCEDEMGGDQGLCLKVSYELGSKCQHNFSSL